MARTKWMAGGAMAVVLALSGAAFALHGVEVGPKRMMRYVMKK